MSGTPGSIVPIGDGNHLWYSDISQQYYSFGGPGTNCTLQYCPVDISVYGYRPTLAGSSAIIALYAICLLIQIFLGFRYKTWGFMIGMVLGCVDEIIGYAARIIMNQNPWGQTGFLMQIVLITIGPVFFSAAIYVQIAQIAKYVSEERSRFRPNLFYWIFIPCDIISLILQAVGGAMSSTSNGSSTVGVNIALAGLSFQVITLVVFIIATIDYMVRARSVIREYGLSGRFKVYFSALTLATLLILTRCCYRVYELNEGYSSTSVALRDQTLFNALEMSMIIIAAYALIVAHPGPTFARRTEESPAAKQAIRTEKRPTYTASDSD